MKLKFDANQDFQQAAISAVVDLFEGQPKDAGNFIARLQERQIDSKIKIKGMDEIGAVGNNLLLDEKAILENLRSIQNRNALPIRDELDGMNFSVEMETGTGKTYVYLRTIFELAKKYSFTKFIILVPSVAIREGVATSIRMMRDHFTELYAEPFDSFVYSGKASEVVQGFATSTNIQIMIMTIQSVKGNKDTLIMHNSRDKLNGLAPIEYLNATQPIIIMDEPQNMEGELSQTALKDLNPLCTLRYSATHKHEYNLVYRLDPVDAHDQGLVKQIVVADVVMKGADAKPYIKLIETRRDPWRAKLELAVKTATGISRKQVLVKPNEDLAKVTGNDAYANNWWINEISIEPEHIELTNHGILEKGESIGDTNDAIYKEMIRETIREHFKKEAMLRSAGMKVLSLFFVDKVASYLSYDENGNELEGLFAKWFDELFIEERARIAGYQDLLPHEPQQLRKAYFAEMKRSGRKEVVDSSERGNANDNDAYDLIMRDKERLLSQDEPVRFIFSHSALREGWDNPNVFQICVLREMGETLERRQTIGRGLRLPVNSEGERVQDAGIAQLTVVANETYSEFASSLQKEYKASGVSIGLVRKEEFSSIPKVGASNLVPIGYEQSVEIWELLHHAGMIDKDGKVTANFTPQNIGFTLNLPDKLETYEPAIIDRVRNCRIERYVKQARQRTSRKLNNEVLWSPAFQDLWDRITERTTYSVNVPRDKIIQDSLEAIRKEPSIAPLRVEVTRQNVRLTRGGTKGEQLGVRSSSLAGSYDLPDIVKELQEATSLTRQTIVDILVKTGRLEEFILNPNDFIEMVKRYLKGVLAKIVVDGIQYERIGSSIYELRELQKDGEEEKEKFEDQLYKVTHNDKTIFDYVVYDSDVERQFAEILDSREDIKLFMKLPKKFVIDTPVGEYNPDWAIIKQIDGEEKIYMIRETKSTQQESLLRASEQAKIDCGKKHFEAIGIGDFAKSSPDAWNI